MTAGALFWTILFAVAGVLFFGIALVVSIVIETPSWSELKEDNDFLFKLAALTGSLLCLVFVLDMDLHENPVSDTIFKPPLVWLTLVGSVLALAFAYLIGTRSVKGDEARKEDKQMAALIGGFFVPGALNALIIGIYLVAK